jgi:4-hydroxyphenylpyruvate dioxygenase
MAASTDLFDNPLGLDGFEFIEFASAERGSLGPVFARMGFTHIANHRSKDVELWRQGGINLIANYQPACPAAWFAAEHGPSACGMGWRVRDAAKAYAAALDRGAEPVDVKTGPMELRIPAIRGIGGSIIYLVDRYHGGQFGDLSIYDIDFVYLPGVDRQPKGAGFHTSITSRTTSMAGAWRIGPASTSACSASARSAISTSRANIPASPAGR